MNIVDIRETPAHLPLLCEWHFQEWSYLYPDESYEQRYARMQDYLDDAPIPSLYVAVDADKPLGSAALMACDMENHPQLSPWLASVYVAKAFRRQGIGARLVQHVMQQAQQQGHEKIYLFTPDQAYFYASLGWQVLHKEQYHDENVTVMAWDCQQQSP